MLARQAKLELLVRALLEAILVVGIRDNTNATRAAVYQDLIGQLNQFNLTFADDTDLSRSWLSHYEEGWKGLSGEHGGQLVMLNRVMFRIFDAAYHSYRTGNLADSQWARFERNICANVAMTELWQKTTVALSDDFIDFAETACRP